MRKGLFDLLKLYMRKGSAIPKHVYKSTVVFLARIYHLIFFKCSFRGGVSPCPNMSCTPPKQYTPWICALVD
jgi:hypothetical protein